MSFIFFEISLVFMFYWAGSPSLENTASRTSDNKPLGLKQFTWQDESRVDPYYGGSRIVNAQVWYPSEAPKADSESAAYYYQIDKAYPALDYWSKEDYDLVGSVPIQSKLGLALKKSAQPYPLIIFSPSLGGNLSNYTYYAECLAKQGYIVMGINHLYESEYVIDRLGNTQLAKLSFHDSLKTFKIPEEILAEEYRALKGLRQRVLGEDLIFSLDQLLKEAFFKDKIDLHRIGAFGHSIGGAAVVYASLLDDRIKAVIDLDGTPPSLALEKGIKVPFLFIEDLTDYENHRGYAKLHLRRNNFCRVNQSESWRILIGGINHNSFLDTHYYLAENETERKKAKKILEKVSKYMNSFFSHHFFSDKIGIKAQKSTSLEIIQFSKP